MNMKQQLAMQAIYDARERGDLIGEPDPFPIAEDDPEPNENPSRTDVARMSKSRLVDELTARGLSVEGRADDMRERLAQELFT